MSTRRGNGEGTKPVKQADGRWVVKVTVGTRVNAKGQRVARRRNVYGATSAEARRAAQEVVRQAEAGVLVLDKGTTLEQWMTHWLEGPAATRVKPATLDAYKSLNRVWITPTLGHVRLHKLTPEHIEYLHRVMREGGRAGSMIQKAHRVLSRALKVAVQRGHLVANPCARVDVPSAERTEITPLTDTEARQLLAAAATTAQPARWTLALSLGLRQSEVLGLCWDKVDLKAGTITIDQQWARPVAGTPARFATLKNDTSSERVLKLPAALIEQLRAQRTTQLEARVQAGEKWAPHVQDGKTYEPVFARADGRPVRHQTDRAHWKALLQSAGVPDVRLHDARHTAATIMLQLGVPARVVMEILGHSTITLTMNTYSHVMPELIADAADRLNTLLTPAASAGSERSVPKSVPGTVGGEVSRLPSAGNE